MREVRIKIFPPYPFSCVGVLKVSSTALGGTSDESYILKKNTTLRKPQHTARGHFSKCSLHMIPTTILLHAKTSCVHSTRLFSNPFCFGVCCKVRLEQLSFLSVSNYWIQSKLLKFSLKKEKNVINHKPNLIRFNDFIMKTVNSEKLYFKVGWIC